MKKQIVVMSSLVVLVSCAGTKFKKDYEVVEASEKSVPSWILDPTKAEKVASEKKKNRYFVNESVNVNKRLCEKSAETRATAHIAAEIAQFMKNSYAEATQGGEGEEVSEYMQEQLAAESQGFIVGTSLVTKYWEKRAYKEALGAEEDISKYSCYVVVKMNKKDLAKAVDRARAKVLGQVQDPEVKQKTDSHLKDVAKAFTDLERPVKIESETEG